LDLHPNNAAKLSSFAWWRMDATPIDYYNPDFYSSGDGISSLALHAGRVDSGANLCNELLGYRDTGIKKSLAEKRNLTMKKPEFLCDCQKLGFKSSSREYST
jgi:hypothetical protein